MVRALLVGVRLRAYEEGDVRVWILCVGMCSVGVPACHVL